MHQCTTSLITYTSALRMFKGSTCLSTLKVVKCCCAFASQTKLNPLPVLRYWIFRDRMVEIACIISMHAIYRYTEIFPFRYIRVVLHVTRGGTEGTQIQSSRKILNVLSPCYLTNRRNNDRDIVSYSRNAVTCRMTLCYTDGAIYSCKLREKNATLLSGARRAPSMKRWWMFQETPARQNTTKRKWLCKLMFTISICFSK